MKNVRRTVAASAAAAFVMLGAGALPAAAEPPALPEDVGELVGATVDPATNTLWLAGAGADDGTLTGVTTDGQHQEITFGNDLTSVQALSFHDGRIYVGDIGDSNASRGHIVVYRLNDTTPGAQSFNAFDFSFPDGPQNATALMVSGKGRIYVVTDGDDPGIYNASLDPSRTQVNRLNRAADAPAGVTDGAFLADGSTMVLRTKDGIQVIDAFTWQTSATEILVGAAENEVLAVGSGDTLLVGSAAGLRESAVPTSNTTTTIVPQTPEVSPSPSPSPSPEPTASSSAEEEAPSGDTSPARTGTFVAIAIALVIAIAAGASTLLARN
ncbi:hypothetical protein [Tessaracoccus caeni]|uniref:hypothetical protein n=1 Tax=Tessaracoccus caeni TaxID=3031239 RepID=UPI0023D9D0C1|nr:hypothetical protein [Tessaracoccus caeni]MDF1488250.1 hypothetical protein [Tessaracoccus caeni]